MRPSGRWSTCRRLCTLSQALLRRCYSATDLSYPVALLAEELKAEDTEARIAAARRLRLIAAAIGADKIKTELLPFLNEHLEEEDEVLLAMADELGGFPDLLAHPSEAHVLLPTLSSLACVEETVVRCKAVESLVLALGHLRPDQIVEHVIPMLTRLAGGDWFTARLSACALYPTTYAKVSDPAVRAALRTTFGALNEDESPMVRCAVARAVGALAPIAEHEVLVDELVPALHKLAGDVHDSVRIPALETLSSFSSALTREESKTHLLPLIKACSADKSWRIRNSIARDFQTLAEAVGADAARAELVPCLARLLQDPEGEVRMSAARQLTGFFVLAGADAWLSQLLPSVRDLAADAAPGVRAAVAEAIMSTAGRMTPPQAEGSVVPLVLALLRDEAAEVRLRVLDALHKVVDTVGAEFAASSILPILVMLASDALWRVRERVLDQIPLMARCLGAPLFEDRLLALYLATYQDHVAAVRMAATRALQPLARALGQAWTRSRLIPKLLGLYNAEGSSYLSRITVLYGLQSLAAAADMVDLSHDLIGLIVRGLRDPVPNVRLVSAQVAATAIGTVDRSRALAELQPVLQSLATDADGDVRHFSALALEKI